MDKEKIKQEAKQVLDKFAGALAKIKTEKTKEDFYVDREKFERFEKEGKCEDKDFKKSLLENAPKKDNDFIIAEKGGWK